MSARLEPACGSLRHIVPDQRPANSACANTRCCAGVPCAISKAALALVSMPAPMLTLALAKKALAAASTVCGSCMPPIEKSCAAASMPEAA